MTWAAVSTLGAGAWSALAGGEDDWADPRLTLLLTESGLNLCAESGGFLAIEAVAPLVSSWVPI